MKASDTVLIVMAGLAVIGTIILAALTGLTCFGFMPGSCSAYGFGFIGVVIAWAIWFIWTAGDLLDLPPGSQPK